MVISEEHKGYTAIAHNAKGYDSQYILKYCIENTIKPYTIHTGTKLMLLEIECLRIKIIDSMNFVQGPLIDLPKTFGLNVLKNGYFPHFFNTEENENYIGHLPYMNMYGYNAMRKKKRDDFIKWYSEKVKEKYAFDMRKELKEYCISDVDILRKGCMK